MSDHISNNSFDFLDEVDPSMLFGVEDTPSPNAVDDSRAVVEVHTDIIEHQPNLVEVATPDNAVNSNIIDLTADDKNSGVADDFDSLFGDNMELDKTSGLIDLTEDNVVDNVLENDVNHNQTTDAVVDNIEDPFQESPESKDVAYYLGNAGQEQEGFFDTNIFTGMEVPQSLPESPRSQDSIAKQLLAAIHYGADGANSSPDLVKDNANASYGMPSHGNKKSETPSPPIKNSNSPRRTLEDVIERVGGSDTFRERYKAWRCCEKRPLSANELSSLNVLAQHDLGDFVRSLGAFIEPNQLKSVITSSLTGNPVAKNNHRVAKHQSESPAVVGLAFSGTTVKDDGISQPDVSPKTNVANSNVPFKNSTPAGIDGRFFGNKLVKGHTIDLKVLENDPQFQHYVRQWMAHPAAQAPIHSNGQAQVGYGSQQGFFAHGYHLPSDTLQSASLNHGSQFTLTGEIGTRSPAKASRKKAGIQAPKPMHPNAVEMYKFFGESAPSSASPNFEQGVTDQSAVKSKVTPKPRRRSKAGIQTANSVNVTIPGVLPGGNTGTVQSQPATSPDHARVMSHLQNMHRVIQEQKQLIEQQKSLIQAQGLAISHLSTTQHGNESMSAGRSSGFSDIRSGPSMQLTDSFGLNRKRSAGALQSGTMDKRHRTGLASYQGGISSGPAMASANVHPAMSVPFVPHDPFSVAGGQHFGGNMIPMESMRAETPCPARRSHDRKARPNAAPAPMMNSNSNGSSSSPSFDESDYIPS